MPTARRLLREEKISRVISTGALPAVPFFVQARALGLPCHYIESAARCEGPSVSGRLVSVIPGVETFAQYPSWAGGRWRFAGSVLDGYAPAPGEGAAVAPIRSAVVTFGVESFGFRRAVDRILQVLPADVEVLWQTGHTDVGDLQIPHRDFLPSAELQSAMERADVVIAHSGTGSALTAMAVGKHPVLLPRRAAFGEHVDDHQFEIAAELQRRGVATWRDVGDLDLDVIQTAAAAKVSYSKPPTFPLRGQADSVPIE